MSGESALPLRAATGLAGQVGTALQRVARHRYPLSAAVALLAVYRGRGNGLTDYTTFATAGRALLQGNLTAVYADRTVQAGPVQLAVAGAFGLLDRLWQGVGADVLRSTGTVAALWLLMAVISRMRQRLSLPASRSLELVIALLALVWDWAGNQSALGHPAEVIVPLLWLAAGMAVLDGYPVRAGLLLGFTTGWETWALLGVPVLLLNPAWSGRWRAAGVSIAVAAAIWLPFLIQPHFAMTSFRWQVQPGTPDALLLGAHHPFTTWMRAVQLLGAIAVGVAVARRWQGRPEGPFLVALAVVWFRLWLDPLQFGYYWLESTTVMLVACAALRPDRAWLSAGIAGLAYLQVVVLNGAMPLVGLVPTSAAVAAAAIGYRPLRVARGTMPECCAG